jgi:hypothetical protein
MSKLLLKEYLRLAIQETFTPSEPPAAPSSKRIILDGPFQKVGKKSNSADIMVELDLDIKLTPELAALVGLKPEEMDEYDTVGEWAVGFSYSGKWFGQDRPGTYWDPPESAEFELDELDVVAIGWGDADIVVSDADAKTLLHSIKTDKKAYAKVDEAIMEREHNRGDDFDPPDRDDDRWDDDPRVDFIYDPFRGQ